MKKSTTGMTILLFLVQACASPTPVPTITPTETPVSVTEVPVVDTASRLEGLGSYPCPDSDFTCVKLPVPLNHFDPSDSRQIDVVFGVLPATGERKGIFVTATGGPGTAGLTSADSYTASFDPSIPEHFDIVFFDQRGVGQVEAIDRRFRARSPVQRERDPDGLALQSGDIAWLGRGRKGD